jgi:cyanophycinase
MTGTIVLQGGGPFVANDDLDRRVLSAAGADRVVVLPTADAFEGPDRLVAAALTWGQRLGVEVQPVMALRRADAAEAAFVEAVEQVNAVYLVGDSPLHLRSVMKDTPLWAAIGGVLQRGGVVVGVGQSAAALCDPMTDPRGGAFTLGLGLISGVAVVAEAELQTAERMARTLKIADVGVISLPTGSAAVQTDAGWELVGAAEAHGDLVRTR